MAEPLLFFLPSLADKFVETVLHCNIWRLLYFGDERFSDTRSPDNPYSRPVLGPVEAYAESLIVLVLRTVQ